MAMQEELSESQITNAANRFAASGPAFRLPTRLAVGFGLEALPAFGRLPPGRWQAVARRSPRSSAPRIRLTNRRQSGGGGSVRQRRAMSNVARGSGLVSRDTRMTSNETRMM